MEDDEVLATLPGLRLQLIRLEYADDDADGAGHLLRAAGEGAAPEVESLLKLPLPPDGSDELTTPLRRASRNGHLQVVRLLCEAGADKDKETQNGATALICASEEGTLRLCACSSRQGPTRTRRRMMMVPRP